MTGVEKDARLSRLEYFIQLAKGGKKVRVEITLRKQIVEQRVPPAETDDLTGLIQMYLLMGDYVCESEGTVGTISKIYVYGTVEESVAAGQANTSVANARLKMDYQRLKKAKIKFQEKYF